MRIPEKDIESPIDTEYCDLPGTKEKSRIDRKASPIENVDENENLRECLKLEQAARERERLRRRDSELKYSQLSSRISTLEHILQDKDDQIQSLLAEKEGHVLVEENLLRTIENSFSKFQGTVVIRFPIFWTTHDMENFLQQRKCVA